MIAAVRFWDGSRIDLDAAVVMPDHVHMILRVRDGAVVSDQMRGIKGFAAQKINRVTRRSGKVWMVESFDHIIRDEDAWAEKIEYVRQNPVKKGLAKVPADYRWLYVSEFL